jgi:PBP1b-binding outer membrane lipoprotein LpoB
MNKTLLYGSIIVSAILFGGCIQEKNTVSISQPPEVSISPTTKPAEKTTSTVKVEDPEISAITNELNNLDASKDFAPYTTSDIQP